MMTRLVPGSPAAHSILGLIWWGGPPGPRGTPRSRSTLEESSLRSSQKAGLGPAGPNGTPEGIRPTTYADTRLWENPAELPLRGALWPGSDSDDFVRIALEEPVLSSDMWLCVLLRKLTLG